MNQDCSAGGCAISPEVSEQVPKTEPQKREGEEALPAKRILKKQEQEQLYELIMEANANLQDKLNELTQEVLRMDARHRLEMEVRDKRDQQTRELLEQLRQEQVKSVLQVSQQRSQEGEDGNGDKRKKNTSMWQMILKTLPLLIIPAILMVLVVFIAKGKMQKDPQQRIELGSLGRGLGAFGTKGTEGAHSTLGGSK